MSFLAQVFHWLTSSSNWDGADGITARAIAQLELSGAVIGTAGIVGIGIGFALGHTGRGGFVAVNSANAARAVPSLALLTLLVTWPVISLKGNGFYASFIALVALAIPPILTNSYVAMREVDPDLVEAAKAVGMSSGQRLMRVEIPLAAALTVGGLRTAAIEVVATSTLAAYVTFNDLGDFIFAGLNTNNNVESFSAALLVAVLAAATDLAFLAVYRLVRPVTGATNANAPHRRRLRSSSATSALAS